MLLPGIDVARVSRAHIRRVFIHQFNPLHLVQEELRSAPDVVDAMVKLPLLVTEGLRVLERSTRAPAESPLAGVRATLLAGFCVVAGALLLALHAPWGAWSALFAAAAILVARGRG